MWLTFTVVGIQPYCLLAKPYPAEQTKRITRLIETPADELVQALKDIQAEVGSIHTTTLHYDGKTGHCITIKFYDEETDRFVYHDPWPDKSLLCKENNLAGVDARAEGKRWSVSAKELESVVFAAFVLPHLWARRDGVEFDILFDEWKESEFFKFFHLKLIDKRSERGMNRHMFAPGSFKDYISLIVDWRDGGKIVKASLILDKGWMVQNITLSLDFAKSFIVAFSPPPDSKTYNEMSQALWKMRDSGFAIAIKDRDPDETPVVRCIHAFMGSVPEATIITDLGTLTFRNVATDEERIQKMEFRLL